MAESSKAPDASNSPSAAAADLAASRASPHHPPDARLSKPKTEIVFSVAYETQSPAEVVALVGSIEALGSWNFKKGVLMETTPEKYPLWNAKLTVDAETSFEYKYVIVNLDAETRKPRLLRWENFEGNRKITATGVKFAVSDGDFGVQSDHTRISVDRGWIENDYQLRLFFGTRDESQWEHRHKITIFSAEKNGHEKRSYRPYVVPMNKKYYQPGFNPIKEGFAIAYNAPSMEELGVTITIWENAGPKKKKIGRAAITHHELEAREGELIRPIFDTNLKVIGEIQIQYLVITPFAHPQNNLDNLQFYKWKPEVNVIGHRGFGASSRSFIAENTLLSFNTAHKFGIKFVEFDVHVTSDGVPVIYHDYTIPVSSWPLVMSPISNLTLKQFKKVSQRFTAESTKLLKHSDPLSARSVSPILGKPHGTPILKELPRTRKLKRSTSVGSVALKDAELRWRIADSSFSTLRELFEKLPIEIGFNVELKYPYKAIEKETNYLERNAYCDRILQVVFDHAGMRPLLFSCFDPDVCAILAKKQPRYPVFFLTEGQSDEVERTYDFRCTSLRNAAIFAHSAGLRGIVTDAKPLLADLSIIHEIHLRGLLIFSYGNDNNIPEQVDIQKRAGVDAVISDKVTKISSAAKVPVNENVERKLNEALNEKAKAAKARAHKGSPFNQSKHANPVPQPKH